MLKTKKLENLLDKVDAHHLLMKHQKECRLSKNFEIVDIKRTLVLSPNTYALVYTIRDGQKLKEIRINASSEETRVRAWNVIRFIKKYFSGPVFYIPNVYFYDKEYNLLAYENVEGEVLINQLKSRDLDQKVRLAGLWLKKLHSVAGYHNLELPVHKIFFNFDSLKKFYPDLANNGRSIIQKIENQLSQDFDLKLIHGDYQPNNIIVAARKIFVFDFIDSRIDNPVLDIAKFLAQLKVMLFRFADVSLFERMAKIFLDNYQLPFNQHNFILYTKMYYLQILCSLSASLAKDPEAGRTLPEVYKYFDSLQNVGT